MQLKNLARALAACAFALVAIMADVAYAEHIIMKNGDKITGTIKSVWDKELIIEPSYSDEFAVDVPEIASIESDRIFEIEFADGRKVDAQFNGADDAGLQRVVIDGQPLTVPLEQIAELQEPEDYYEWESRIDANATVRSGNTDSSLSRVNANSVLKLGDHRQIADLTVSREETDSITSKEQMLLQYNYNWLFSDAIFLSGKVSFERDPIRDLDSRIILGAGLGYDFWAEPSRVLSAQAGFGFQTEEIDFIETDSSIFFWSLRFSYDLLGGDLNFFHNDSFSENLSGRKNSIFKSSTGLRYEISDLLYGNVQIDYDYESNPASAATSKDFALLFGLGLEF